ncbi:MAG: AMP-binding protein, partial [bacterium]|nr:AMP-binding protein [bacterium]
PLAEVFSRQTVKALAEYIAAERQSKYTAMEPVEKKENYALSSAQKRLYFLQQMDTGSTAYNMPMVIPMGKEIEKEKLQNLLAKITALHESLRTAFVKVGDETRQRVYDRVRVEIEDYDIIEESEEAANRAAAAIVKEFVRSFDLAQAPLMRSGIIKHPDGNYTWMVDMHHIISDGTSGTVLVEDFIALNRGEELKHRLIQYKEYSTWQNRKFESGAIKQQEEYWVNLLNGELPVLQIPTDIKRPEVFTFEGDRYRFSLEGEGARKFKELAHQTNATLYMNILAAVNTLFYKYTGQTDIIIGSGIAGRPRADLQRIIGMFVNTLAMRNYPEGAKTYTDFLEEVIANSVEAFENQEVQFEELVDKLDLERDPSRNPLFDISMVVQNFRQAETGVALLPGQEEVPGMNAGYKNITSKFDMTFFIFEDGENVYFNLEYYTAIFKKETIKRMVTHFMNIIAAVSENPALNLDDIEIMTPAEKQQILQEFNDTARQYPAQKTIHGLFEEQVEKTPHHIAIVGRDIVKGKKEQMGATDQAAIDAADVGGIHETPMLHPVQITYSHLNEKANQIARYLQEGKGLKAEERVGIYMTQSTERITAILGILKAGGAYVPIDPALPEERIKYMVADAAIGTVISEKKYLRTLNRIQWQIETFHSYICLDSQNIAAGEETEKSQLMDEELWQHVGETATDDIGGGGWTSSYTGEPFTRKEM